MTAVAETTESPALILARDELAHAEAQCAAARQTLEQHPQAKQAQAELAYYRQQADRYRTEIARLLRGDTP